MNFKSLLGVLALAVVVMTSACKKGFKTTDSGLQYMYIVESDTGEVAGEEGYLKMHIVMKNSKDSTIIDTYKEGNRPAELLVRKPTYEGCIYEGFALLKAGDSAAFKVLADSLYLKSFGAPQLPPGVTTGEELTITVKVEDSKNKESFEKMQKDEQEKMAKETQAAIQQNIKDLTAAAEKMGLKDKLQTLPSGLMYVVMKETKGNIAKPGDKMNMFYKGTLLDGTVFDSSRKEPYPVFAGQGGVIQGWIEALEKMKEGEKWKLFIPSNLAYGAEGSGPKIGPNTPLIFDVEMASIIPAEKVKAEEEARMKKFQAEETKKINDFIKKQNYKNIRKDTNGIYYITDKPGTGATPKEGELLSIEFHVYQFDGTEVPMAQNPMEIPFARGAGIPPAMVEGMAGLKQGGKVTVITPSTKFLGPDGGGRFEPYTPLRLTIELLGIKPAGTQPKMPQ